MCSIRTRISIHFTRRAEVAGLKMRWFDRDAANVEHIARHGIAPQEAEDAVRIEPLVVVVHGGTAIGKPLPGS